MGLALSPLFGMHELPSIEDGYLKVASDPIVFERDESVASHYILSLSLSLRVSIFTVATPRS